MVKGRGQGERAKGPPTLSLLLSSTFVFLRSRFRATVHCPLSTIHSPLSTTPGKGQFIVGQRVFFQWRCKGSIDIHLGAFAIFKKAQDHAATIPALALIKRHFFSLFSVLLQRKVFGHLFLMMVFHRRSKRVKMFSETFVTMYLYKHDSNTSKRTCLLMHNYLKEKTRKRKKVF